MKLVGFVVIGIVTSIAICFLLAYVLEKLAVLKDYENWDNALLLWSFMLLIHFPFSFLLGSFVTGFLSYPEIENKKGLFFIAPGLYFAIIFPCMIFSAPASRFGYLTFFACSLLIVSYFYLVSLAGAALGWFLKRRIMNRRYGDL